jgi:hypothetical protein
MDKAWTEGSEAQRPESLSLQPSIASLEPATVIISNLCCVTEYDSGFHPNCSTNMIADLFTIRTCVEVDPDGRQAVLFRQRACGENKSHSIHVDQL